MPPWVITIGTRVALAALGHLTDWLRRKRTEALAKQAEILKKKQQSLIEGKATEKKLETVAKKIQATNDAMKTDKEKAADMARFAEEMLSRVPVVEPGDFK